MATEVDNLQCRFDKGPCPDAAHPGAPAIASSQDLAADPRWPLFGPAAARVGMSAMLATALEPSTAPSSLSGALNVYSRRPRGFTDFDHDVLCWALTSLAHAQAVTTAGREAVQPRGGELRRDRAG